MDWVFEEKEGSLMNGSVILLNYKELGTVLLGKSRVLLRPVRNEIDAV